LDNELRITPTTLRAIHALNTATLLDCDDVTNEEIKLMIAALQSEAITDAERALGTFTCRKLKTLDPPGFNGALAKQLSLANSTNSVCLVPPALPLWMLLCSAHIGNTASSLGVSAAPKTAATAPLVLQRPNFTPWPTHMLPVWNSLFLVCSLPSPLP
jgi:hypothetical protein